MECQGIAVSRFGLGVSAVFMLLLAAQVVLEGRGQSLFGSDEQLLPLSPSSAAAAVGGCSAGSAASSPEKSQISFELTGKKRENCHSKVRGGGRAKKILCTSC